MSRLIGFKFETTLVLGFQKIERDNKTKNDTFYLTSKVGIVIDKSDNDDIFESIFNTNISNLYEKYQTGLLIQT